MGPPVSLTAGHPPKDSEMFPDTAKNDFIPEREPEATRRTLTRTTPAGDLATDPEPSLGGSSAHSSSQGGPPAPAKGA